MDVQLETMPLDTAQPESTRYYALEKLAENARMFAALADILPTYRERLEQFLTTDRAKAKEPVGPYPNSAAVRHLAEDIHELLVKERERLTAAMNETRLKMRVIFGARPKMTRRRSGGAAHLAGSGR